MKKSTNEFKWIHFYRKLIAATWACVGGKWDWTWQTQHQPKTTIIMIMSMSMSMVTSTIIYTVRMNTAMALQGKYRMPCVMV
jgi:hypothetical protein